MSAADERRLLPKREVTKRQDSVVEVYERTRPSVTVKERDGAMTTLGINRGHAIDLLRESLRVRKEITWRPIKFGHFQGQRP
jgi:hypothetical protein